MGEHMKTEESSSANQSKPVSETPSIEESPNQGSTSKIAAAAKKVGTWLIFLAGGALAVGLVLYLPARSDLNQARTEIERLEEIERQYNDILPRYELTQAQSIVYKTISDMILLREALSGEETTRVSQQLRYVEDDLNDLVIEEYPEILPRLQSQFNKIRSSSSADPDQALEELEDFFNDLLLLADNLE